MTLSSPILAGILGLGTGELIAIFFILILLFGATKLPSLARGLGQSMKEFKKASRDDDESDKHSESKKPADAGKTHGSN